MKLHHLKPDPGARRPRRRVGRGEGGHGGKTAGRGTKGQKARGQVHPYMEGGQMPLQRRMRKLKGFRNPNKEYYALLNVGRLDEFPANTTVGPDEMRAKGLIKKRGRVKVLGEGEVSSSLTVRAHAFSLGAVEKIKAAGGKVEVIEA